jgi:protein TonB
MVRKNILFLILFTMIVNCNIVYSQTEANTNSSNSTQVCNECDSLSNSLCPSTTEWVNRGHVEKLPSFPGGEKELMKFLSANIQYPKECMEMGIQGRVITRFIVDETGKIICPIIARSLHPAMDEEALRVIKLMPDWQPASNNGIPFKLCYTLPVLFRLQTDDEDKQSFLKKIIGKLFS